MKFKLPLIAVKSVEKSKKFYEELFEQHIEMDFGKNVVFSGGFSIQEDFGWLVDIDKDSVVTKSNNMELYFETEDFDDFMEKLRNYKDVEYVHKPKKHSWEQRVVRIYDPDYHIIEIGEAMEVVVKRVLEEGNSIERTSEITQHPISFVKNVAENIK